MSLIAPARLNIIGVDTHEHGKKSEQLHICPVALCQCVQNVRQLIKSVDFCNIADIDGAWLIELGQPGVGFIIRLL